MTTTSRIQSIPQYIALGAALVCMTGAVHAQQIDSRFNAGLGYRSDDLDWNIAGNTAGQNPNVLSELTWTGLDAIMFIAEAEFIVNDAYVLRGNFATGSISDGDNQDSDFAGNNRTLEFSRTNNDASDGDLSDYGLAAGYRFALDGGRTQIIPLVGYSRHKQELTISNGVQTIDSLGLFGLGPFPGLNSTYDAQWEGWWAGLEVVHMASQVLTLRGSVKFHEADYEAVGDFNLRSDLKHPNSFRHVSDGSGTVVTLEGSYAFRHDMRLNAGVTVQDWSADAGIDRAFFIDNTIGTTRLNDVNWDSTMYFIELEITPGRDNW